MHVHVRVHMGVHEMTRADRSVETAGIPEDQAGRSRKAPKTRLSARRALRTRAVVPAKGQSAQGHSIFLHFSVLFAIPQRHFRTSALKPPPVFVVRDAHVHQNFIFESLFLAGLSGYETYEIREQTRLTRAKTAAKIAAGAKVYTKARTIHQVLFCAQCDQAPPRCAVRRQNVKDTYPTALDTLSEPRRILRTK